MSRIAHRGCDSKQRLDILTFHLYCVCSGKVTEWSEEYYDMLSITVGGGKPKMRWCVSSCGLRRVR